MEATDETGSLLSAFTGNYVLPGPSGIITRGREDILPTGRNFYTLDPRRLPTRAAWRVGQNLARALIAKHLEEEGRYPENVAMFWMCNDMMWADGEGMGAAPLSSRSGSVLAGQRDGGRVRRHPAARDGPPAY